MRNAASSAAQDFLPLPAGAPAGAPVPPDGAVSLSRAGINAINAT